MHPGPEALPERIHSLQLATPVADHASPALGGWVYGFALAVRPPSRLRHRLWPHHGGPGGTESAVGTAREGRGRVLAAKSQVALSLHAAGLHSRDRPGDALGALSWSYVVGLLPPPPQ